MFPILTRVFWAVVQPVSLVALLVLLGLLLGFLPGRWLGRVALALGLVLLCLMAFTSLGYAVISPLENRFVRPAEPQHVDGIIVLGGALDGHVNAVRQGWELNEFGDRYVETLRLALRHPEAKVLVAAGPGAFVVEGDAESVAAERFFTAFGIAHDRLLLDDQSRNTEENAQNAKALAGDTTGRTWLLVTSAFHMPRAVGLFRKAGFSAIPWPTDYLATGVEGARVMLESPSQNITVTSVGLREWVGLMGYKLTGKIDDLFPGP
jgi:uncharacterized SAM-binding protein YcdF (DUF218 family)